MASGLNPKAPQDTSNYGPNSRWWSFHVWTERGYGQDNWDVYDATWFVGERYGYHTDRKDYGLTWIPDTVYIGDTLIVGDTLINPIDVTFYYY